MKSRQSNSFGIALLIGSALAAPSSHATEEVVCRSPSFTVSFSSGSEGYISGLAVSAESLFEGVKSASSVCGGSYADLEGRRAKVVAKFPGGETLVMRLSNHERVIEFYGVKEEVSCDWGTPSGR